MGVKKNGSALLEPQRAPESIVVFYVTQEVGLPTIIQGLNHTVVTITVRGPSGSPVQNNALRVAFPVQQSTEHPVGLVAFGSDPRCHFILDASDACEVHCKVWAQLNSGPDVWIIEDSSALGTQFHDEETVHSGQAKTVHGRRQASKGLRSITIGSSTFGFRSPISNVELRDRDEWFRCNPPIPVSKAMLDQQVREDEYDICRMSSKPIGEGGNGKVYKFMEKNTALLFAVKAEQTTDKKHEAIIWKEVNFMKRLRHVSRCHVSMSSSNAVKPFLVEVLFADSDNQPLPTIYTAMPLYRGHLGSILPLPNMPATERVMLQIAEGLRFMHSNLILHRDLKTENILVASQESIKIADYGWATSLEDTDSLYGMCGTMSFCAPEAYMTNEIHTAAIDVYSLGAVFYSILDHTKVKQGWVVREFRGRKELFNTTFENASTNPPNHFPGLVKSMLDSNPKRRCSLNESIEVVMARNHTWTNKAPVMPKAAATDLAVSQSGTESVSNPTRLQQIPFGRNGKKAKNPKPTQCAHDKRPEHRQTPQQAPVKHDIKNCQPARQRQEPARLVLQVLPIPKPRSKPSQVQGVDFNAGLPSYEEATSQPPFASLARKEGLAKNLSHLRRQVKEPRLSRHPAFRSRNQAVNLHRANDARVHRRHHEPPNRQAWRNRQLAELQRGAYGAAKGAYGAAKGTFDTAKGTYVFSRALLCLACDGLLTGGERVFKMFKDNPAARQALDHAAAVQTPNVSADAQLVASVQRQARRSAKLRSVSRMCTDEEMLDRQLLLSRRR